MAVVLPALRLFLLLLNIYGTFKTMKPPPVSQRSTRNGQGPSIRAMQLRKRELKSRLAVWVVWAIFSTLERPLDRTLGFITPFYTEIKCTVLLFLVVTRSHGAEAIFLHLIHPLLRPYVPAVDNILASLSSIFDLITLLVFLPWEYVSYWWRNWDWSLIWTKNVEQPSSGDCTSGDSNPEDQEDGLRRLRPRNGGRQAWMKEANRQAQEVLQELDDAQGRVRTRARGQFAPRNNARTQPIRETRNTDPSAVGLRIRKRVLDCSTGLPDEVSRLPGSRSTGVHHLDFTITSQLAQGTASQRIPVFSNAPTTQPILQPMAHPSPPIRMPTPSSSSQSGHEIWYPPQSSFEGPKHEWTPPDTTHRTPPSPIYPPLPSAYQFTPRRSDPLPPPPHSVTPPDVAPTSRRVSTGAMSRRAFDVYDGIDQFPGRSGQTDHSTSARPAETFLNSQGSEHRPTGPEDSFQQALEPSIQAMDVDTLTLLMRDGSSASEEFIEEDGGSSLGQRNVAKSSARHTKGTHGGIRETSSGTRTNRQAPTRPLRRSARTARNDRSSSVETDEFGFTIRQGSNNVADDASSLSSLGTESLAVSLLGPKPLARTKPALKTTQEEGALTESSDEESVKKRRKVGLDVEGQSLASAEARPKQEISSARGDIKAKSGKTRSNATVQETAHRTDKLDDVLKDLQVGTRATRASTRQPVTRQGRGTAIKRGKGKRN